VAGVGAAHAGQQVVFGGEVVGDVAFAFAAEPAADHDIHQPLIKLGEESKLCGAAHRDILRAGAVGVDDRVGLLRERADVGFGGVLGNLGVGGEFDHRRGGAAGLIAGLQDVLWGEQVDVDQSAAEHIPQRVQLCRGADRVDDHDVSIKVGDRAAQPIDNPASSGLLVKLVAVALQRRPFHGKPQAAGLRVGNH